MTTIWLLLMIELWGILSRYIFVNFLENQAAEHNTGQLRDPEPVDIITLACCLVYIRLASS